MSSKQKSSKIAAPTVHKSGHATKSKVTVPDDVSKNLKPGAYRLIKQLKDTITGHSIIDEWPGVLCDEEITSFLLIGKKKPNDGREAYHYPGLFKDKEPPQRAGAIPMYLIGKKIAIYVPSNLLQPFTCGGLKAIADSSDVAEFRDACASVLEQHARDFLVSKPYNLARWKAEMRSVRKFIEEDKTEPASLHTMVMQSIETVQKASSSPPEPEIKKELEAAQVKDRAKSADLIDSVKHKIEDGVETMPIVKETYERHVPSKEEREVVRHAAADRRCKPDEVRIVVGNKQEFIVPRAGLAQSMNLVNKAEWMDEEGESQVFTSILAKLDGDEFEPVAEFMVKGDFEPEVLTNQNGTFSLRRFDMDDAGACRELTVRCVNVCKLANSLKIPQLRYRSVCKLQAVAKVSVDAFVHFVHLMKDLNFCDDDELRHWVVKATAAKFYRLCVVDSKFVGILEDSPEFATMVHRVLAGLPAVEAKTKGRKRPRKAERAAKPQPQAKPAVVAAHEADGGDGTESEEGSEEEAQPTTAPTAAQKAAKKPATPTAPKRPAKQALGTKKKH